MNLDNFSLSITGGTLGTGLTMINSAEVSINGEVNFVLGDDVTVSGSQVFGSVKISNEVKILGTLSVEDGHTTEVSSGQGKLIEIGESTEIKHSNVYGNVKISDNVIISNSTLRGDSIINENKSGVVCNGVDDSDPDDSCVAEN